MSNDTVTIKYKRQDFLSATDPRWCPGCGCYGVFKGITATFANAGIPREKFAVISGIGCSSRLPYYAETYGFHSIHGRAPTVAMGVKMANPDLSVWIITGDGDSLSIGGNHFMHLMRRNPNIKMILFNNQIYGLTKGQISPTSPLGKKTKTTPLGSIDTPVNPVAMALSAGATFVARVPDNDGKLMEEVFDAARRHNGVAFIEVFLNCVIFNEGAFESISGKDNRADNILYLKHGEPLLFGKDKNKGIVFDGVTPRVAAIENDGFGTQNIFKHDAYNASATLAFALAQLNHPEFPVPMGIFRQVSHPVYEEQMKAQEEAATEKFGTPTLDDILFSGEMWKVDENGESHPYLRKQN